MAKIKKTTKRVPAVRRVTSATPVTAVRDEPAPIEPTAKKVLVLRSNNADLTSSHGFTWPASGPVEAPDWSPEPKCGGGLHGLLWGIGDYSLTATHDATAKWLVVEVAEADVVQLDGKVKFPRGNVVYCGRLAGAMNRIMFDERFPRGTPTAGNWAPASTAGYRAPASTAGYGAPASTAGNWAPASTAGDGAPASTAGYGAPASTAGNWAPASTAGDGAPASTAGYGAPASTAGNWAPASTAGDGAPASTAGNWAIAACLGTDGKAKAGPKGTIAIAWEDGDGRRRVAVGYPGENGIKPDQWYAVRDGQLAETTAP